MISNFPYYYQYYSYFENNTVDFYSTGNYAFSNKSSLILDNLQNEELYMQSMGNIKYGSIYFENTNQNSNLTLQ